jgi:hypothetical protein
MPVESYFDILEPPTQDAEIWRFMSLHKFQDLMGTRELFFCRADLFEQDEEEGIPPEYYLRLVMGVDRYSVKAETDLNHQIATFSQFREMYYVNCWHLFRTETPEMWKGFAQDGVAVCSRYELLKSALDGMVDKTFIGLMRYGDERLTRTMRLNTLQAINTKRAQYAQECEVRAIVECGDPLAGHNLHFDENNFPHRRPLPHNEQYRHHWVHKFKRRRVDLSLLITGVVVTPGASKELFEEVELWKKVRQDTYAVRRSDLTAS